MFVLLIPTPTKFGYEQVEGGILTPIMMTQQAVVPELLNLVVCEYLEDSCSSNCSCFKLDHPSRSAGACDAAVDTEDDYA